MTEPYVLDIDMKLPTYVNEPIVKQRDDITIVVNLLDNGLSYDFTDSTTLTLTVARLDKVSVTVGGTQTNDNQITFKVPRSAVSVIGRAEATIQIYGSDGRSSSTTFFMSVQRDPSSQTVGEGEKTLIEVVLSEGPAIIADAQTAATNAQQVADDNQTRFLEAVSTVVLRDSTYPEPKHGDTVRVTSEAKTYRYERDAGWVVTDAYNPTAIDDVSSQLKGKASVQEVSSLTQQLADTAKQSELETERNRVDEIEVVKADKADLSQKRNKVDLIGINDADPELLGLIQDGTGGTPVNVLSEPKDLSVTFEKTDFIKRVSRNLIDPKKIEVGGYYSAEAWVPNGLFYTSGMVPVKSNTTYARNSTSIITYYKKDRTFLSALDSGSPQIVTAPPDAAFARFVYRTDNPKPQLNEGSVLLEYDEYEIEYSHLKIKSGNLPDDLEVNANNITGTIPAIRLEGVNTTISENLFNKDTITRGGYVDRDGNWLSSVGWNLSDYIQVEQGVNYVKKTVGLNAFYDSNKVFIKAISGNNFITPPLTKYARVISSDANLQSEMFVKGEKLPSEYIPHFMYTFDSNLFKVVENIPKKTYNITGKKWLAMGDSNTFAPFSYVSKIKTVTDVDAVNIGLDGRSMASRGAGSDAARPSVAVAYLTMPNEADYVTVAAGVNDYHSQVPLGDKDSTTITEFYGALNVIALGLIEKYAGKKIGFITPLPRRDATLSIPLNAYVDAIKETGRKYSIPVFDLYANSGLYPDSDAINSKYFGGADGLHPNTLGWDVAYPRILNWLETL